MMRARTSAGWSPVRGRFRAKSQARGPVKKSSGSPEAMWMPYSSPAYLWPSWLETSPPMSQPPAAYFSYPRVSVISVCQRSETFQKLTSEKPVSGPGNPKPGRDGTITSNASAGSPPNAAGSASGSITFDQCQNVHGQPWVRINGTGRGPRPGLRMKCTGTPATLTS